MILALFLCFVSLLFVFAAPSTYSYEFCMMLHWIFVVTFIYGLYIHRREGYVNYWFTFSIGYYFVNFVYPVYYYPTNPDFSLFKYHFDHNLISYCTAVALCAYTFLLLGLMPRHHIKKNINKQNHKLINNNVQIKVHEYLIKSLFIIFILVFALFITTNGLNYFTHQFSGETNEADIESGYIFSVLQAVTYPLWILVLLYPIKNKGIFRIPFISLSSFIIIILLTGSRTLPIALIIIAAAVYNDRIKKFRLTIILTGIVVGAVVMTLAGTLRGSGELISSQALANSQNILNEQENYFDFAQGLIINNRSLYSLIGFADSNTYTYGLTLIGATFNVIPFMVTLLSQITGIHTDFFGSATFNTFLSSGHFRHYGLGTNAVSDIYLAFGIIGVIIIFYFFGRIICWLRENDRRNIFYCIAYYVVLSGAIYTCRSTIFGNLKPVLWSVFIVWALIYFSPKYHQLLNRIIK